MFYHMKKHFYTIPRASRGRDMTIVWGFHATPFGRLLVAQSAKGICWAGLNCTEVHFKKEWPRAEFIEDAKLTARAAKDIIAVVRGKKPQMPVALYGTPFQVKVWKELLKINCGATVTYQDIAKRIGKPKAVRAVGSAVGKNTISILVPCHRVVNKTGAGMKYAWGPEVKRALLKAEGAL
jgi:AraC family transcriptional regulator of adaptative response/methylated-DNA-[protein]-cysteine methyltransferase